MIKGFIIYNEWNLKYEEMKDCVSILKVIIDTRDGFKQCSMLSINEIYVTVKDTCNRRLLNLFTYKTLKQMKCTIICFNNV